MKWLQQLLMEKSIARKCHVQLWFVLIASFLLCLVLLLSDYSALSARRNSNGVTFLITNFESVIVTTHHHHSTESLPPPLHHDHDHDHHTSTELTSNETKNISRLSTLNITTNSTTTTAQVTSRVSPPAYSFDHGRKANNTTSSNWKINGSETITVINNPAPPVYIGIGKNNSQHGYGTKHQSSDSDSCLGRYIYVYDLPDRFNKGLLKNCPSLLRWNDMCPYMSNKGLGSRIHNSKLGKAWFATNQFSLEVIFHNRMKQYKCLTNDSSLASAIFVPFYAGLDVGRYLWDYNTSVRDASSLELVKWLAHRPEWKKMWGRDHFLVGGRIAWDFRRPTDNDSDWGSKLMFLPQSKNMTFLSIESSSWNNEQAIPYPTYFHPSKQSEVFGWQRRLRKRKRPYLFSFAGAPRPNFKDNIRGMIINQCQSSTTCKLVGCYHGASKCDDPLNVMKVFQASVFCLQPSGDSFTRRSTFDSILAGCIPVFFHPGSAYVQYSWHFPNNPSKYSVFISENDIKDQKVNINEALLRIPKKQVLAMREEVIRLIPRIIYADPGASRLDTLEDAFDIAVKGVLDKVEKTRRDMKEGKDPGDAFSELNPTKFDMPGQPGPRRQGEFRSFNIHRQQK